MNRAGLIYKLRRNRRSWRRIGGRLIHVSAGEAGVWSVSRGHYIYYRLGKSAETIIHRSLTLHLLLLVDEEGGV